MNDKQYMFFKIAHLIMMAITTLITIVDLIGLFGQLNKGLDLNTLILIASGIVRIMAMDIGMLYLVSGYKKQSAVYYKVFFGLLMAALFFRTLLLFINKANIILIIGNIITIVIALLLFVSKNLGRNNSLILFAVLIILEVIMNVVFALDELSLFKFGNDFSYFLLFGTAGFMISGKYIDKELRGTY